MLLTRTVDPAAQLISDALAKAHLRIDHAYDNTTLDHLRAVVESFLDGRDGYLQRALVTQSWLWQLPCWPVSGELWFPLPPLQSVTHVKYYDDDNTLQTLDAANYSVITAGAFGYIKLVQGASWPSLYDRDDAVQVTFVAGYGDTASDVPPAIIHAALLMLGHLYAGRGDSADDPANAMTDAMRRLLAPYRLFEFKRLHEQHWFTARANPVRAPN